VIRSDRKTPGLIFPIVFEDFTDDLAVWVLFYGSGGGEIPASDPS